MGISVRVGAELLRLADRTGAPSIVVVGTGKNVGKTVVVRALCEELTKAGCSFGLASIGRDGEAFDVAGAQPKPRLFLRPGTIIATARTLLPAAPAVEVVASSLLQSAAGPIVFARIRTPGFFEIAGPPSAAAMRSCIAELFALGAQRVVIDGAVDRIAMLAGGGDAVIVATGAANAAGIEEAVDEVRSLVRVLQIPKADPQRESVFVPGALTATAANHFVSARESRQIVVRDPTQIALRANTLACAIEHLDLRCERPLNVVAVTVASIGGQRYFEPQQFARKVAGAVRLPVFDAYAASMTAA